MLKNKNKNKLRHQILKMIQWQQSLITLKQQLQIRLPYPAEQTTVTVNQTINPMDQSQLQPLRNQTIISQTGNLSNIENKTVVQATDPVTTTIAKKTTVPFN